MPVIVRDLDNCQVVIAMLDSSLEREQIVCANLNIGQMVH